MTGSISPDRLCKCTVDVVYCLCHHGKQDTSLSCADPNAGHMLGHPVHDDWTFQHANAVSRLDCHLGHGLCECLIDRRFKRAGMIAFSCYSAPFGFLKMHVVVVDGSGKADKQ